MKQVAACHGQGRIRSRDPSLIASVKIHKLIFDVAEIAARLLILVLDSISGVLRRCMLGFELNLDQARRIETEVFHGLMLLIVGFEQATHALRVPRATEARYRLDQALLQLASLSGSFSLLLLFDWVDDQLNRAVLRFHQLFNVSGHFWQALQGLLVQNLHRHLVLHFASSLPHVRRTEITVK